MDKNQQAVAIFNKLAERYQARFMDVSLYHDSFNVFCAHVPRQNAAVLDIACGPGNITRYLLGQRPDFKILGIDLSENMVELARVNNPTATFEIMDARKIDQFAQPFDAIMCGFCLPYLSKEEAMQLIRHAAGLLVPGGLLYISTMEDDYSKSGIQRSSTGDEVYMYYHQADYLSEALLANGFEIMDQRHQPYPTDDETQVTDLILIATLAA